MPLAFERPVEEVVEPRDAAIALEIGQRHRSARRARDGEPTEQQQNGDAGNSQTDNRPAVFGGPAATDQHDIGGNDALDHWPMAKAALHRTLVEVPAVPLPGALAA